MAKKEKGKTIFDMDLDTFKKNVDTKLENETFQGKILYLQWVQIGMLRRIGRYVMGLDDPSAKEFTGEAAKPEK